MEAECFTYKKVSDSSTLLFHFFIKHVTVKKRDCEHKILNILMIY